MSEVIDLDALIPPSVTVKFGGDEFEIKPPKTSDILKLGFLGQKLADSEKLNDSEIESLLTDLNVQIIKCIPELEGKELNTAQTLKLVEIISNMAVPPETKELDKRGISTGDPKAP